MAIINNISKYLIKHPSEFIRFGGIPMRSFLEYLMSVEFCFELITEFVNFLDYFSFPEEIILHFSTGEKEVLKKRLPIYSMYKKN